MKKKRYTLPEEQPIPVGWHPANKEEAADKIEAIEAFRDDKLPSNPHRWCPIPEPRHYPYPNDNPHKT